MIPRSRARSRQRRDDPTCPAKFEEPPYLYPTNPISGFDLDGNSWWRSAAKFAWKYKWDIAMNAAMFVPGIGEGVAAVRLGAAALRVGNIARKAKYAEKLVKLNNRRHRVTITSRRGAWHYDLAGKGHYSKALGRRVDTPHKVYQPRNHRSPSGWDSIQNDGVRSMTWRDMYRVRWHLR